MKRYVVDDCYIGERCYPYRYSIVNIYSKDEILEMYPNYKYIDYLIDDDELIGFFDENNDKNNPYFTEVYDFEVRELTEHENEALNKLMELNVCTEDECMALLSTLIKNKMLKGDD